MAEDLIFTEISCYVFISEQTFMVIFINNNSIRLFI